LLTVTGTVDGGIPYDVTVDQGVVTGSPRIADLLERHTGRQHSNHPTQGGLVLALDDEASVLAALRSLTTVVLVEGEPEDEYDDSEADRDPQAVQ
jgi:hypothetical protein